MQNDECCICLKELNNDILKLECNHIIHNNCYKNLINSKCPSNDKCPICRNKLKQGDPLSTPDLANTIRNNIPLPIMQALLFCLPIRENSLNSED